MDRRLCRLRAASNQGRGRDTRGFGLLEVMLLLMILGTALAAGFLYLKATEGSREAQRQQELLQQADRYVKGFVAKHHRLPCPATTITGTENCSATTGSLPFRTLGLEGGDVRTRIGQLRYSLGATAALTVEDNYFSPHTWDGTAYPFNARNGADFCQALETAGAVNAYTLIASSTLNTSGQGIGEQTLGRRTDELAVSAGCALLTMSLETLSRAADVVSEVNQQKADTVQAAIISTTMNGIATVMTVVNTVMAGMDMAAAVAVLATASAALATAIATCVVLVGCAEIPHAAASVAAASAAVAAAGVAIAANVASAISQAVATGLAADVLVKANGQTTTTVVDMSQAIAEADAAAATAAQELATRQAEATVARQKADNAKTALDALWTSLLNLAHADVADANNKTDPVGTRPLTQNDGLLSTVRLDANALEQAKLDVSTAQGELEVAIKKRDELNKGLADLQTMLANETDPAKQTRLTAAIASLNSQITDAQTGVASAQAALASRQSVQAAAASALTSAESAAIEAFCFDKVAGVCTVVDHRGDMQQAVDYSFLGIDAGYVPEYRKWFDLEQRAIKAEKALVDARATATDTANRAQQLRTISAGGSSSGSEISVWNGAEAILQAADAKGAME
ncbi:hypothetical protein Q9Q94_03445 [Uliginosibacterium sp. 31-16]|uniref:hypothetical protein n=1 Tax=Uliginosibacterium sp. 31-16 TaxID=3068315 RepID=UPI00273EB0DB|nr:hypothetical protein [Uliginosibacterium sp. 31-16]MDP5238566.1 hypothetical protein [Uliginosibacterium sp. 31-16]